jgi:hypothetical protein
MVALALYMLLSLLGTAVGLSVRDQLRGDQLGSGAAIWAILSTLIALFVGGFGTTLCTAGENRAEATLYGIILWGVLFAALLWLMATGVRLGFNAMMGVSSAAAASRDAFSAMTPADWDRLGRQAGLTDEQIRQLRLAATPAPGEVRREIDGRQIADVATTTAWWAFGGTLLSMLASILGALVGAGPSPFLRFITMRATRTTVTGPGTPYPTR